MARPILEMKRTGELDPMHLLSPGQWELVRRDSSRETVQSDGTRVVDMRGYCWVWSGMPSMEQLQQHIQHTSKSL